MLLVDISMSQNPPNGTKVLLLLFALDDLPASKLDLRRLSAESVAP